MADDEQGYIRQLRLIAQLRAITGGLEGLAGSGARLPPVPGAFPLPVPCRRRSIEALQAQLTAFDGQLAVLEQILSPLAEWSSTWAELNSG
jgi:hypothetical protein